MKPEEAIEAIEEIEDKVFNPEVQCNCRLYLNEKTALIALARRKGAVGITGLLKMLAKAERVEIYL